jgi:ribosomal-protein-alanine N-acetyltransferase
MAEFRIRKAAESDLDEIIRLWKRNIRTINTASDIAELFCAFENYFFVAVSLASADNSLIGFVGGAVREGHGHISGIAVEKEYRRRGIGKRLIKAAEREFLTNAFDTVTLEVRRSNWGAIRFYEKQGYKHSYIVKGYYADGEDALVYTKKYLKSLQ